MFDDNKRLIEAKKPEVSGRPVVYIGAHDGLGALLGVAISPFLIGNGLNVIAVGLFFLD
ncbi:MAG: hypothetical protein ACYDH3_03350 [Candidatus Aminicenantales bacterium]